MIPLCVIAEKLPWDLEEKARKKSLRHVKSVFEALVYFQENPDAVFLVLVKEERRALEWIRMLSKADPQPKTAVICENASADFERQAIEAGALDIFSSKLSFPELCRRIERIGSYVKSSFPAVPMGSILIVDDDEGVRKFLSFVLMEKGHEVLLAESGEKALEMLRISAPSVVLLDMMMPGMGGLETLKRLLEIKPNLGVVMATGLRDEALAHQSMELGAYAYVMKPFDLPYLEMVVLTRLYLAA